MNAERDSDALTAHGWRLLRGDAVTCSPKEAIETLSAATDAGGAEAPALLATILAWGFRAPRDITRALDLLALAAERGWRPAQAQLQVLARANSNNWRALRASIDMARLRDVPQRVALSEQPPIRVLENFATTAECDWLVQCVRGRLERARVYQGNAETKVSDVRNNTEASLQLGVADVVASLIVDRAAAAANVSSAFCEVAKVLHYEPGQQFGPHADFYNPAAAGEEISARGQRVATLLIYLNDDYDDGATEFMHIGIRYKGRKGDALLFANVDASGAPDLYSVHQGRATTRGEKWLFSQWIRDKPINPFATPGASARALAPGWLREI